MQEAARSGLDPIETGDCHRKRAVDVAAVAQLAGAVVTPRRQGSVVADHQAMETSGGDRRRGCGKRRHRAERQHHRRQAGLQEDHVTGADRNRTHQKISSACSSSKGPARPVDGRRDGSERFAQLTERFNRQSSSKFLIQNESFIRFAVTCPTAAAPRSATGSTSSRPASSVPPARPRRRRSPRKSRRGRRHESRCPYRARERAG